LPEPPGNANGFRSLGNSDQFAELADGTPAFSKTSITGAGPIAGAEGGESLTKPVTVASSSGLTLPYPTIQAPVPTSRPTAEKQAPVRSGPGARATAKQAGERLGPMSPQALVRDAGTAAADLAGDASIPAAARISENLIDSGPADPGRQME